MSRVPPTHHVRPDRLFVWPCGCVTRDSRAGAVVQDCTSPENPDGPKPERDCYRRHAPPVRRIRRPL